jgi:hypothetical protein
MATTEELQARLDEAQSALHKVMIGKQTVRIVYDGVEYGYSPANVGDLRAYILELQVQLGQKTGRCRASKVWF